MSEDQHISGRLKSPTIMHGFSDDKIMVRKEINISYISLEVGGT